MSKEHAYAYEAGYRDGSIHYELEHCPACKNVADLQEALAENAKLREQIHWLKQGDILHVLTDQEYIDQCERERLMQVSIDALDKENAKLRDELENARMRGDDLASSISEWRAVTEARGQTIDRLAAENAKLLELVRDYERCSVHADCGLCEYDGKLSTHCPLSPCFPDIDELRELGVEVDG